MDAAELCLEHSVDLTKALMHGTTEPCGGANKERMNMADDDFDDYQDDAPIEYLEVGEREDMVGGPASVAGWFLHPECMIGCCASEGPFPTKKAALEADRIRWEEIAESFGSKNENDTEYSSKEIEPLY